MEILVVLMACVAVYAVVQFDQARRLKQVLDREIERWSRK